MGADRPLTAPVKVVGRKRVSASIGHGESWGSGVSQGAGALGFISVFGPAGASYKQSIEQAICRRRNRVGAAQANITGRNRLYQIMSEVARSSVPSNVPDSGPDLGRLADAVE